MKQSARVFIAKSGAPAVVVTMHVNEDGIWYEDEAPAVLNAPLTAAELGTAVGTAMRGTVRRAKDLRGAKVSDWPAYRASGAPSVRQFEQLFLSMDVEGANQANLVAVVTGWPEKDSPLQVTSSVSSAFPVELGKCILRVYEACRDRRV
jgi:hypothetical protein